jgi:catechol 2,3-dioxygenase-like lactoylglutathione lyase family enzyme
VDEEVLMEGAYIGIVSVPVSDTQRARDWYTEVLGFGIEHDEVMDGDMRWIMLRPTGGGAAITLVTWFESMTPGSMKGTVLSVPDIEAAAAHLRAHGAVEDDAEINEAPWGRWLAVDDPDGNGWVVQQPTT